jgi:hypothetical protein
MFRHGVNIAPVADVDSAARPVSPTRIGTRWGLLVLGHPSGACEVALEGASRPIGFTGGIDVQDDPSDFCLVRTCSVGIEQAQIGDEMFVIISG